MKTKYFWLEKLPFKDADKLSKSLLNGARKNIANHLLSDKCDNWMSGYLTDNDITKIEKETNRKVRCSTESGEYFYKLEK